MICIKSKLHIYLQPRLANKEGSKRFNTASNFHAGSLRWKGRIEQVVETLVGDVIA